jgi:hypothetical protein
MSNQLWIAETRNGATVGWLVIDKRTGQIVRAIRYADR